MSPDLEVIVVMLALVALLAVLNVALPREIGKPPSEWPYD